MSGSYPAVAPNGRTMAFARPSGPCGLRSVCARSVGRWHVPRGPAAPVARRRRSPGLAWTAGRRRPRVRQRPITGTSGMAKTLWRIPATEGARPRQVPVGDDATAPAVPSRRRRLAFVRNTLRSTVAKPPSLRQEHGRSRSSPARPRPGAIEISISPDGNRVAFESTRTGESAIWVSAADGSNPIEVFSRPGRHSGRRGEPDGQRIAFDSTAAGSSTCTPFSSARPSHSGSRPRPPMT